MGLRATIPTEGNRVMALDLKMLQFKNPQKLIAKADSARDRKEWHQAASLYKEALTLSPENYGIWVQYGHALKESGQIKPAENAYRRAIDIAPLVSDTHLQLGHVLKLGGRLNDARMSYQAASSLDPSSTDAIRELSAIDELTSATNDGLQRIVVVSDKPRAIFDCSDLIQYFRDNRLPTGIQRVQINIVTHYMSAESAYQLTIIYFDINQKVWRQISSNDFQRLCNSAQALSTTDDNAWKSIYNQICTSSKPNFEFHKNDILVNLGTSWWIPDYFLHIRMLKRRYKIYYLPFIHDCIPVVTPEFCSRGLTEQFKAWLVGVLTHSDGYFVNSRATAADLKKVALQLGHPIADPTIVYLDGDTRSNGQSSDALNLQSLGDAVLLREGVPEDAPFVLMVSTLEIRKNHLLALQVWAKLIEERGEKCPYLICVGKQGWQFDATMEYFDSHRALARRVRFVSNVSDVALADLYHKSLFTFYPSHYEGWGLPVTESLCYGKVALVAENSSLTEAGGEFADYFETGSARQAQAAVAKLIDDLPYRKSRETRIADRFKPRPWIALAQDIANGIARVQQTGGEPVSGLPNLVTGKILTLKQYDYVNFTSNELTAEHSRKGYGWHLCEPWGTWMGALTSSLGFAVPSAMESTTSYLRVRGHPNVDLFVTVARYGTDIACKYLVKASSDALLRLEIGGIAAGSELQLTLNVNQLPDLDSTPERRDLRNAGVGIIWLAVIENGDLAAKLAIFEAVTFDAGSRLR